MVSLLDWMRVLFCYRPISFYAFYVHTSLIRAEILISRDKALVMGRCLFKIDFFFQIELKHMIFSIFHNILVPFKISVNNYKTKADLMNSY